MENIKFSRLKSLFFFVRQRYIYLRELFFLKKFDSIYDIPIIINNYNRVTYLRQLISFLENKGYHNLYIIDNASTYPPLLDYYNSIQDRISIFRLDENVGYLSIWKTGIYKKFANQYFVYTDSDILPTNECPIDFIGYFFELLQKYRYASKVGFALKIDDLPNHFRDKQKVIDWESRFWLNELEPDCFKAAIDTTFALYRPNVKGGAYFHDFTIRVAGKYAAYHLPWYNNSDSLSEEDLYYIEHSRTSTHWTVLAK